MRFNQKLGLFFILSILLFFKPFMYEEATAQEGQEIEDEVAEENLELPDIHENTMVYNGTINPDFQLRVAGPGLSDHVETPDVNDAGQFSMTLTAIQSEAGGIEAGNQINFFLWEEEYLPYSHTIKVQPAEEGMEIVESSVDTSQVQNPVLEATQFNWIEEDVILLEMETVGDVEEVPYYTVNNGTITVENYLEEIEDTLYRASFTADALNIGDIITVYILASGVTTPVEIEVPDSLTSLQDTSQEELEESEVPDEDTEAEDQDGGEEAMDTEEPGIEEDEEVDPAEPEGEVAQDEGLSAGWVVAGVVIGLAVIGGIIYTVQKRRR